MRTAALLLALTLATGAGAQQTGEPPSPEQTIPDQLIRKGLSSITSADTTKKVKKLSADELEGRNAGYKGCWEAAEWIGKQFEELKLKPIGDQGSYFQTFTFQARQRGGGRGDDPGRGGRDRRKRGAAVDPPHHETPTTRNVVALLEGSDPELKNEVVILGGHYDHVGREGQWNRMSRRGNSKGRDDIWNGADDNASGTGVVIEIAEAFVASGIRPRRSILFILFSAEEHGLFGSKWYCDHPLIPLDKTVAMLNFDMVGYKKKKGIEIVGVDHASGQVFRTAFLKAIKEVRTLKVEFEPWARSGGSDHAPFIEARVPAVFFFNGLHPDYHTIDDELGMVSGRRMAEVAKVGFLSAIDLAQLDVKPEFVPASGEASAAASLGLKVDGFLGEEEAKELHLPRNQGGIKVGNVYTMTPAAEAGLEDGDIILAVGREEISLGNEKSSFENAVRKLDSGRSFSLKVLREGKKKTLKGKMP